MYATKSHIYGFKCFGKAIIDLQFPGRSEGEISEIDNVNLVLGDNGGGKSSVLRAVAIAMLAPTLMETGFVAYRLVRRPDADTALLKLDARLTEADRKIWDHDDPDIELLARIDLVPERHGIDRLHLDHTPASPLERLIYSDSSHAFFVAGYGATRRVETSNYIPSSELKRRGARYQRVASLFEDHIALRPLEALMDTLTELKRKKEGLDLINRVLPNELRLTGRLDKETGRQIVKFNREDVPFDTLSDGYRAFVGMVGDLVGHLADVCPSGAPLDTLAGIVLIDEVDLHLHPSWQRRVVTDLANAFPALQFILTSHSPLVVAALERQNIFVTDVDDEGHATIKQIGEHTFGRSVDQLLLSSYFGLETTRPVAAIQASEALIDRVSKGEDDAALEFMRQLGEPQSYRAPKRPKLKKSGD